MSDALLVIMTPEACQDPNQWAYMTACEPHSEALLSGLQEFGSEQYGATVVQLRLRLGLLNSAQGRYGRAREQEEHAVTYAKMTLGEEHPDTLTSMSNLAVTLSHQGDYAGAAALQRQVLDLRQRILGKEHPSTSLSAWNYLNTLFETGDTETALEVAHQYLLWLLEHDPSTLGGYQTQIRAGVAQLLESSESS